MPTAPIDSKEGAQMAQIFQADLEYKMKLMKQGKIIAGGPFLDILADCYILQVKTVEEMGEIFFNSPANFVTDREVHPLGTYQDSMEGMKELQPSSRKKSSRK